MATRLDQPSRAPRGARPRAVATRVLVALLLVTGAVRVPLLLLPGYGYDMQIFREWTVSIVQDGLVAALHRPEMNYIGYAYVLGLIGWLREQLGGGDLARDAVLLQAMKLPGILADLGVAALLYRLPGLVPALAGDEAGMRSPGLPGPLAHLPRPRRVGLAAAALYAFNPATLYTSGYWGQIDSVIALAMLGSVSALLCGRPGLAGALLASGFLMKPQPIVLVPVLVWCAWRWHGWGGAVRSVAGGAATVVAGLAYFLLRGQGARLREIYDGLFEAGEQISVSAMNIWWLVYRGFGDVRPHDTLLRIGPVEVTPSRLSLALVAIAVAWLVAALGRRPTPVGALLGAAFIVLCFYLLPMKMHERYLFPLFALLAPVAVLQWRWLAMYGALAVTYTLNLFAVMPVPVQPDPTTWAYGAPGDVVVSLANVALLVVFAALLLARERDLPDGRGRLRDAGNTEFM